MTAVDEVAGTTVAFDNGESHTYNLASQRKLLPMLDDAHPLTSETLFRLVDTDSSGSLDLNECAPPPDRSSTARTARSSRALRAAASRAGTHRGASHPFPPPARPPARPPAHRHDARPARSSRTAAPEARSASPGPPGPAHLAYPARRSTRSSDRAAPSAPAGSPTSTG